MSISDELFLSILAMDSYNRGYSPGITIPGGATSIGNATIGEGADTVLPRGDAQAAGFYALSYTWHGQTVISYRGTDDITGIGPGASDLWRGWITSAGALVPGGQAQLAVDFYNSVASGNVILTGHSLGGALMNQM